MSSPSSIRCGFSRARFVRPFIACKTFLLTTSVSAIAVAQTASTPLPPVVVQPGVATKATPQQTARPAPQAARVVRSRPPIKPAPQQAARQSTTPAQAKPAPDPTASQPRDIDISSGQTLQTLPLDKPSTAGSRLGLTPFQTPATVNIIPGELARDRDDTTIQQVISRAPGISQAPAVGNGNSFFVSRGFYGATAVQYLDDSVLLRLAGNTAVFPFDPWNVDRIEILNGPATTLYGAGSIGGAVNVISRKPDFTGQHGEIDLLAGSRNTFHEAIDLTGPITPDLAYRLDAVRRSTNGFTNDGSSGSVDVSTALEYRPLSNFTVKFTEDYGNSRLSSYEGSVSFNGQLVSALKDSNFNVAGASIENKTSFTTLREEWAITDNILFRNYSYFALIYRPFFDATSAVYNPFTQRVTLSAFRDTNSQRSPQYGDSGSVTVKSEILGFKNETLLGFDANQEYLNVSDNRNAAGNFFGSLSTSAFNYTPVNLASAGTPAIRPHYEANLNQYGFFAEDRIVLSKQLSILAGTRFDQYNSFSVDYIGKTTTSATPNDVAYHAGVVYEVVPKLSIFGQYSTGADPFASLGIISQAQSNFVLSPGREVEAGIKEDLFDGRLIGTFSAYDIVKNNVVTTNPSNPQQSIQAGQQSAKGLELALSSTIGPLTLGANGTILDPKFDAFSATVAGQVVSLAGYRPQFVPSHTGNIFAIYRFLPNWAIETDLRYVGNRYADNADQNLLPQYTVVGFGLRYTPTPKIFTEVRVDNAFNKTYALSANQASASQIILGDPLTVTGRLNYRF